MDDSASSDIKLKEWKKNRSRTYVTFCMEYFVMGSVYALGTSTYWVYIKRQLKPSRPYLIYTLMTYLHYFPTMIFALNVANLHDRFRKSKLFITLINLMTIIGAVIFTIDISEYFPVIGCLLLGVRYLGQPVMVGELARSYYPEELTFKLPVMNFFFFLATAPASVINYLARDIDFNIGPIQITFGNFSGIVIAILYIVMQLLACVFMHDISAEFDLKASLQEEKKTCMEVSKEADEEEPLIKKLESKLKNNDSLQAPSIFLNLKRLFYNIDMILLYFLVWLYNYISYFSFAYAPLLIQDELQYDAQYVNVFYFAFAVLLVLFLPFIIYMKVSSKTAYYAGLISYILMIFVGVCYKVASLNYGKAYNITLLAGIIFLYAIIYTCEDIFLVCTMAKLAKPDIQSFADGMRGMMRNLGSSTGCLSVPLFIAHKNDFYVSFLLILLFSVMMIIFRRSTLQNPKSTV